MVSFFISFQLHLHRHHFIKERTPPLLSPTMGREESQGIRAFESEPAQPFGKLSSGWHGLAPAPDCGWGLVSAGPGVWAQRDKFPPPEGCPQNAASVNLGDAFQTWDRPAYRRCSIAGPQRDLSSTWSLADWREMGQGDQKPGTGVPSATVGRGGRGGGAA